MSQFSQELCNLESSTMVYICRMSDCIVGSRLRVIALILLFYPFFFVSFYCMLTLKICVSFLRNYCCEILKHGIHMKNEFLYCGIENWTHCSYSSLYLSIFLSFKAKFVSWFSQELFKLESSIMECLCKMSDHIMGLKNKLIALFLVFLSIFFFQFHMLFLYFQFHMLTLKICTSYLGKY